MDSAPAFNVLGMGSCLPSRVVTNDEVGRLAHFPSRKIREFFEIEERRWVRSYDNPAPKEGEHCSDMCANAAREALEAAGLRAEELDTIVAVSTTPDLVNPPLDYLVGTKIGASNYFGTTIHAPCTGLFRAAATIEGLMQSRRSELALIVCGEAVSPLFQFGRDVAYDHRLSTVLYADAAAAMVVARGADDKPTVSHILVMTSGDRSEPGIRFPGWASSAPFRADDTDVASHLGYHDFRRVLRRGSVLAINAAFAVLEDAGVGKSDVAAYLTHQATGGIHRIVECHGLPPTRYPTNIARVGNTISASILLLLAETLPSANGGDRLLLHTAESSTWSWAGMMVDA